VEFFSSNRVFSLEVVLLFFDSLPDEHCHVFARLFSFLLRRFFPFEESVTEEIK